MRLVIAIDDTDDFESKGTGEIAEEICARIEEKKLGFCTKIVRHQLFVHQDIPYTSHNSSMSFIAVCEPDDEKEIIEQVTQHILQESSPLSDPGVCIVTFDAEKDYSELIQFGKMAKSEIFTKEDAYSLAKKHGVFLNEYGGLGIGVIGALAGTGLRISGNDGRFKGRLKIAPGVYQVKELLYHKEIDDVQYTYGKSVTGNEIVIVNDKLKTVLINHQAVLLVEYVDNELINARKQLLRSY